MRILHVISGIDEAHGGPAVALSGLATAEQAAGLRVSVLATFGPDDDIRAGDRLGAAGIDVALVGPVRGALGRHPQLWSRTRQMVERCDVVHIHSLWEDVQHQAARACQETSTPYIFRPCGMLDPWSLGQSRWKKRLYMAVRLRRDLSQAAAIHFTSATERDLAAPLRLPTPAIVEPNGVNLSEFDHPPTPGTFRGRHGLAGRPIVLFLSRVHPKKGLDLLIPAFAAAFPAKGDSTPALVVAGPDHDGYGAAVRSMAQSAGITEHVIFTGMLRGVERVEALADADLFVLPSYQENFGVAVVEALAAGTPVIVSDQVNIHAEIQAGAVGGVVPTEVAALAAEMRRWMTDPALRTAAAAKARPFVAERYDWRQIARRWAGHYDTIAAEAARR